MKIAIIVSKFNPKVTQGLLKGAIACLKENGLTEKNWVVFDVPGAFEIPLIAKKIVKSKKFNGMVCLGAVIKGQTAHFEFISLGVTMGIMQVMLETETPISFGILTAYTDRQAQLRSRENSSNKGREAVAACLRTLQLFKLCSK